MITTKKYFILCALPVSEDYINSFQVNFLSLSLSLSLSIYLSESFCKPLIFNIFRWLERQHWSEMSKSQMNFHT